VWEVFGSCASRPRQVSTPDQFGATQGSRRLILRAAATRSPDLNFYASKSFVVSFAEAIRNGL